MEAVWLVECEELVVCVNEAIAHEVLNELLARHVFNCCKVLAIKTKALQIDSRSARLAAQPLHHLGSGFRRECFGGVYGLVLIFRDASFGLLLTAAIERSAIGGADRPNGRHAVAIRGKNSVDPESRWLNTF